jgi:hypothetical protein
MFDTVTARYVLRCALVGIASVLVSLQASSAGTDLHWGEVLQAFIAGGIAALAYAGIGAASTSVEPNIGNKREE